MDENMNRKDSELKESMSQFSKIQLNEEQINKKTLEEIKKEINENINYFKSINLENQILKINSTIEEISKEIKNKNGNNEMNKILEEIKKKENEQTLNFQKIINEIEANIINNLIQIMKNITEQFENNDNLIQKN